MRIRFDWITYGMIWLVSYAVILGLGPRAVHNMGEQNAIMGKVKPLPVGDYPELEAAETSKGTAGVATKAIAFGIVNVVLGVVGGWYLCMDANKDTFAELRSMQLYAEKSGCGARDVSGGFYWKPVQVNQPVPITLPTEANNFSAFKTAGKR